MPVRVASVFTGVHVELLVYEAFGYHKLLVFAALSY
jgi:hypothetical protein